MRYLWLAIIAVSLVPVAAAGVFLKPLVLLATGVFAFSTAVYSIRWG